MPDPIYFGPLTDSPETLGDAVLTLPELRVFGLEAAGGYGIMDLPRLAAVGGGGSVFNESGAGVVVLPSVFTFGSNATVGLAVTYPGYSIFFLPSLATVGASPGGLIPNTGWGLMNLPGLTTLGAGVEHKLAGAVELALQPLQVFGLEAAGAWGIIPLPGLASRGVETVVAPDNFSFIQQSPGYLQSFASNNLYLTVDAGAQADVTNDIKDVLVIQTALRGSFSIANKLRAHPDITLSGELSNPLSLAYGMLLDLDAAGDVTDELVKQHSLVIADALTASLSVESRLRALYTVAMAGVLRDAVSGGTPLDVSLAGVLEALVDARVALLLNVDTAGAGDVTMDNILRMSLVVANEGVAALDATSAVRALLDLDAGGVLYMSLRFGADDYSGWVMNTETLAPSQYQNYPFDGFAVHNDKHYGFGPGGTVRFDGGTDDGAPIPAWLRTFFMDFGAGTEKRVSDAYVGATNAGQLVLKVVSHNRGTGAKTEDWYAVKTLPSTGAGMGRAQIGQGLRSTWWQFELHNVGGSDFELEEISFRPILIDRRV